MGIVFRTGHHDLAGDQVSIYTTIRSIEGEVTCVAVRRPDSLTLNHDVGRRFEKDVAAIGNGAQYYGCYIGHLQLVKEILESFGEECVGRDTKTRVDQLKQFLFARFKEQQACVLFINEAQQMKGSLLESLRGLLNFEDPAAGGKLLQIHPVSHARHQPQATFCTQFQRSGRARPTATFEPP